MEKPWCYTVDTDLRWDYCIVPPPAAQRVFESDDALGSVLAFLSADGRVERGALGGGMRPYSRLLPAHALGHM